MQKKVMNNKRGMILILSLWSLSLLVVFALNLGFGARQKITFVSRIESRNKLSAVARSGVRKGIALLAQYKTQKLGYSALWKMKLMNDKEEFYQVPLDIGHFTLSHYEFSKTLLQKEMRYGMMGEEGKININVVDPLTLERLFRAVLGWEEEDAEKLVLAIMDWRTETESFISGFHSDNYYKNLEYPYAPKNQGFETIDEVLLISGVDENVFDRLYPYITVWGDGSIDVNAATWPVFYAVGFSQDMIDKILTLRRGTDEEEATHDDLVFTSLTNFVEHLAGGDFLSERQEKWLAQILEHGLLKTESEIFSITSTATFEGKEEHLTASCVYDTAAQRIVYWNQGR